MQATEPRTADEIGLTGIEKYYGIEVCTVGEDGALIAIGHHEPRRVLAAWNAYVRQALSFNDLRDYHWYPAGDLVKRIASVWLVRVPWCGDCDRPDECEDCPNAKGDWWWWLEAVQSAPGAFPAMWLD